ncbi:MAG: phage portal protein [Eubacterium sp.]|nr:phage portal protein [Eubacterium sp.]
MENNLITRVKNAWNVFRNKDPTRDNYNLGTGYYIRPDRPRFSRGNERSIVSAVYNRIALDVSSVDIRHVRLDKEGKYLSDISSGLNTCLTLEANTDQTGRAFMQDVVMSMLDEGHVAIVPVETVGDPWLGSSYDILSLRTGRVIDWYPKHVRVELYNELTGNRENVVMPKSAVAIIENPFYAVMNEPNSTLQRLLRKLTLLDGVDEAASSGKLDLIIQLPYVIKSEARKKQAEERRKELEQQLAGSKYGIAYTDGTEHITQLNRSVENNLMKQIEYLTSMLYSQLGITQAILDDTADEKTMLNYNNRTIEPITAAISDEMNRKFLTKTARSQGQSIKWFRDPFRLVPVNNVAEIADKFTRNEIMTSNEIRQVIGMKPSDDPKANQLVNSNIAQPTGDGDNGGESSGEKIEIPDEVKEAIQNGRENL